MFTIDSFLLLEWKIKNNRKKKKNQNNNLQANRIELDWIWNWIESLHFYRNYLTVNRLRWADTHSLCEPIVIYWIYWCVWIHFKSLYFYHRHHFSAFLHMSHKYLLNIFLILRFAIYCCYAFLSILVLSFNIATDSFTNNGNNNNENRKKLSFLFGIFAEFRFRIWPTQPLQADG